MKKKIYLIGILALLTSISTWALPAPKYLSVPKWKTCTATETRGSAQFVCLPAEKPCKCPTASWKKLTTQQLLKPCAASE